MVKLIVSLRTCRTITAVLSIMVFTLGLMTLLGWVFHISDFKTLIPDWRSIKFNTSVCFVLSGIALYLLRDEDVSKNMRFCALVCAALVFVISGLTLIEYLFKLDLGIDQLFFIDHDNILRHFPGRMAFTTALNFLFIAFAIYFIDTKIAPNWFYQLFLVLLLPMTALGFLYHFTHGDDNSIFLAYINLAFYTIIDFSLIICALFFIRPQVGISAVGLSDSLSGYILRLFIPGLFIIPLLIIGGIAYGVRYQWYDDSFGLILASSTYIMLLVLTVFGGSVLIARYENKQSQMTALLAERETLFTEFTENIDLVFWRYSPESGMYTYVSPAFEKIYGLSIETFFKNQKHWVNMIILEDRFARLNAIAQILKGSPKETIQIRVLREDGVIIYVSEQIFPLTDKNGTIEAVLGVARDTTSQYYEYLQKGLNEELKNKFMVSSHSDMQQMSETIKKITLALGYDIGQFWLFDEQDNSLDCLVDWHKDELPIKSMFRKNIIISSDTSNNFPALCFQQKKIQYSTYAPHLDKIYSLNSGEMFALQETIGAPLVLADKNIGVICFYNRQKSNLEMDVYKILMDFAVFFSEYIQNNLLAYKLKYLSNYDPITGLPNQASLAGELDSMIAQKVTSIVLIELQINNFNLINHIIGFELGNDLLQELGKRFSEVSFAHLKMLAASGPGIFSFLLANSSDEEQITRFVYELFDICKRPIKVDHLDIHLSINAGISRYPQNSTSSHQLINDAFLALIDATTEGSYQFKFAKQESKLLSIKQLEIEEEMHNALKNNELELYYQPQVSLITGKIVSVEALIRWHDPKGVLRLPSYFISVCEQSHLILDISDWVLKTVITDLARSENPMRTALNLSASQFNNSYQLLSKLEKLLESSNIDPNYLEIEVTETLLMSHYEQSHPIIEELKNMGISIALDDFGTGYSSFIYLKKYLPQKIKIDKSFIDGIPEDANSMNIIKAIIALSHSLKLTVIAEGVETEEQVKFLMRAGCDEIQGFYYSEPLPFTEMQALIKSNAPLKFPSS